MTATGTVHVCEAVSFVLMPVAEVVAVTRSVALTESVTIEDAVNVNALVAVPFAKSAKVTTLCAAVPFCGCVGKSCQIQFATLGSTSLSIHSGRSCCRLGWRIESMCVIIRLTYKNSW